MISAERVKVNNTEWIKVKIPPLPPIVSEMAKVRGARFNKESKLWSVPYENRVDFENRMADFLIVWEGDEETEYPGGIKEVDIPSEPIVPGYSVTYDNERNIIDSSGFKNQPWGEYQVKGFNLLVTRDFLILGDEMGLGKTFQISTAIEAKKKLGQVKRGVVLCKASLTFNWRDELHMHTDLRAHVISGTPMQRYKMYSDLNNDSEWSFIIMSYETYRVDIANIQLLDNLKPLDFCIVDEAHKIKNPNSKIGSYIHYVPYKCKYVLTGTPLPNTPLEAYNYLKWGGCIERNWWAFRSRYAILGGFGNREIVGYKHIRELRKVIQCNMLRRLKKHKLKELPDIIPKFINIQMNNKQTRLYEAVKKEIMKDLEDTTLTSIPSALSKLLRLQQVTNSPALIGDVSTKSSKLDALDELLEELIDDGGSKVIIFSRFKEMTKILKEKYKKYDPAYIDGDVDAGGKTKSKAEKLLINEIGEGWFSLSENKQNSLIDMEMTSDRQMEVYKFQQNNNCKLFIGTSGACREGLTLTAATHVIFIDCEWSPAYVEQAYSRAHRIGQKNAVNVYYLICEGTIDEYIQDVLSRKESMAQIMLDSGVHSVKPQRARSMIATLIGEKIEEEG